MSETKLKRKSLVDSTYRLKWEITKEQIDKCQYPDEIVSEDYSIEINGEETVWRLFMHPKGSEEAKNKVSIFLALVSIGKFYKVSYAFGIETQTGYWPSDAVAKMYSRDRFSIECHTGSFLGRNGECEARGYAICDTDEFEKHFVNNKVTVVASFVIYLEGNNYRNLMEVADEFVGDMRAMSSYENLTDFTIISGDSRFPCHRIVLATRSEYFEGLFRNEPTKKELKVDESPDLVKAVLEFVTKGLIPDDIDNNALDLILVSDMYGLDLLTLACETSLVNNLSPDNAVETLITIDKLKHVSKLEHRNKVLAYIKKDADKVSKAKDWKKFVINYPDLITEIMVLKDEKNI